MDATITSSRALRGTLSVPADKAIAQRAVLLAAVASGQTTLHPWPPADDCQRALQVVEELGVSVRRSSGTVVIAGRGREGLRAPPGDVMCGESGTTFRLAAGLLAGQPFTTGLAAGPGLSRRPMRRIVEPLCRMGAKVDGRGFASGQEIYPPLMIHGRRPLRAMRYELVVASAQVKSAILLAGLFADGRTTVVERRPTRDHTERLLSRFGIEVSRLGPDVSIRSGIPTSPGTLTLPGDFSSAAFFLVAGACVPGSRVTVTGVGLNPTRAKLLQLLERMGASVSITPQQDAWEPRGDVTIEARPLHGLTLEAGEVPQVIDELPVLMVAAACATGTTRLTGIAELRVKETDRITSMATGLRQLGARVRMTGADGLEIDGGTLTGAAVAGAGDHRTIMSLAVAGLIARGTTSLQGIESVGKSFPDFFEQLRRLAGPATVKTVDKR